MDAWESRPNPVDQRRALDRWAPHRRQQSIARVLQRQVKCGANAPLSETRSTSSRGQSIGSSELMRNKMPGAPSAHGAGSRATSRAQVAPE
jgi:hypothetical protein